MPNQMIALQARAPQTDILGGAIQRGAAMINQMRQQAAAERQAAQAQQSMDIAKAQEERAAKAAEIKQTVDTYNMHRAKAPAVRTAEGYALWLNDLAKDAPQFAEAFRTNMPVDKFSPRMFAGMVSGVDDWFKANYGTAITRDIQLPSGDWLGANISSVEGSTFAVPIPDISKPLGKSRGAPNPAAAPSGATPPPYQAPSEPATDEAIDAAAKAIAGGKNMTDPAIRDLTPNDLKRAQDKAMKGVLAQPIAFNPAEGMSVADLTVETAPQIVQAAMQNGMIDQKHVEQLRQIVGPENDQALASWMRQNNVRIQPTGEASFRSAVYRPGGEDMFQQVQYDPSAYQTVRGKSPMQSPLPGSSQVPLPRVSAEKGAETAGAEEAKRIAKLRTDLPAARSEAETFINELGEKIKVIDQFLRSPTRRQIIGSIEGRLPRLLQDETRSNEQANWDFITNNATLQKLIDDRKATETGASPQGIISDRDLGVAASAATKLTQTGSAEAQEKELQRVRDVWYASMMRAKKLYDDTYGEVIKKDPRFSINMPNVPPRYAPSKQPKPTPSDVDALRRNRNNSNYTEGFRRTFGEDAFRQAMGGR